MKSKFFSKHDLSSLAVTEAEGSSVDDGHRGFVRPLKGALNKNDRSFKNCLDNLKKGFEHL